MSLSWHPVPYDSAWPLAFERLRGELLRLFAGTAVQIEHIGSTAVPGLCAKPVIDLLLGAPSLAAIEAQIPALAGLGYAYVSRYEAELPQRRYFVRPAEAALPRVHLHGVCVESPIWRRHLAFRDALRGRPEIRDAYAALKRRLAQQHASDKSAYTEAKAPFIIRLLADAGPPTEAPTP